jgi:hypothetical protein
VVLIQQRLANKTKRHGFEFIGGELMLYSKQIRTAPFKMIAGHDTTAGFINFLSLKENPLFNAYISQSELAPGMEDQVANSLVPLKAIILLPIIC